MKRLKFADFANDHYLCFHFGPNGIRFFTGKKKLFMKILVPLCFYDLFKSWFHGFNQDNILRFYLADYITTLNKCKSVLREQTRSKNLS